MKKNAFGIIAGVMMLAIVEAGARNIDVIKSSHEKVPVDISGIRKGTGVNGSLFIRTLQSDLKRSGWFSISQAGKGSVTVSGTFSEKGAYATMRATVGSRATGRSYFSRSYNERSSKVKRMAHTLADDIVLAVKKVNGIARTRIVMIGSRGGTKDLYVCDYDGANLMKVTRDAAVCLAPGWGPDGKSLVYTSFLGGFPDVYKIDLTTNKRRPVAGYPGLNAGADISPDGKSVVLTLSKDGNPDLYIKNLRSGKLARVTRTQYASEASPSWSPDGNKIVYVSDKASRPQIFVISRAGGKAKQISFGGNQNVAPDWGPDGKIAYSSRRDGKFHICWTDPGAGGTFQLTSDHADYEDPSWAPDGRHIVCSRSVGYNSELYVLDTLGDPPVRLLQHDGDWYSPGWSPK